LALSLKVNEFLHSFWDERMVTSSTPLLEAEPDQQVPEIVETDVSVGSATQ
jgi:hypothetical protein